MYLKPQDTLLALKYWSSLQSIGRPTVRSLSETLRISTGEVSKSTHRLLDAKLLSNNTGRLKPVIHSLYEWVAYGVLYAYPVKEIGYGRGLETSWSCKLIKSEMMTPNPEILWPVANGGKSGILIEPFHPSVPFAASRDKRLYLVLSLIEAVRLARPRELTIAREQLNELIIHRPGKRMSYA